MDEIASDHTTESRWRLVIDSPSSYNPAFNVGLEEAILEEVGAGKSPPSLRIWQNRESFVVGRYEERETGFKKGLEALKEKGLKVIRRCSGGSIAPQGKGIINISLFLKRDDLALDVREAYLLFGRGLKECLTLMGEESTFGKLENSFCNGTYNLLASGKKVAGLAQTRRREAILVHAVLLNSCSLGEITTNINAFYRHLPYRDMVSSSNITSLANLLGRALPQKYVVEIIRERYATFLNPLKPGSYTRSELNQARTIGKSLEY